MLTTSQLASCFALLSRSTARRSKGGVRRRRPGHVPHDMNHPLPAQGPCHGHSPNSIQGSQHQQPRLTLSHCHQHTEGGSEGKPGPHRGLIKACGTVQPADALFGSSSSSQRGRQLTGCCSGGGGLNGWRCRGWWWRASCTNSVVMGLTSCRWVWR